MNLTVKNQTLLLLIVWLLVQGGLYFIYGVDASKESLKYIGAAKSLIDTGQLPSTRYFFYLTTTLIIAFCLKTGLGYGGVVVIQLLLNLFATNMFFRSLLQVQQKRQSAFFTTLLLITFLPYQTWNFYLYTESVFYSCVLLFFSSCISKSDLTTKTIIAQTFLIILTIISRPLGIIFLPCWVLYLAIKKKINPSIIIGFFLVASAIAIGVINTIMSTISDWQILKPAEFGYIICDIPSRPKIDVDNLKHYSPITQLVMFILQYPSEFFRLCLKRWNAFFSMTRNYYNAFHNLYMIFYAAIFILPFLYTVFFLRKTINKPVFYVSIFIVLGFAFSVAMQCDDYHNRFHHAIVPVFLFGGVFLLFEKWLPVKAKIN